MSAPDRFLPLLHDLDNYALAAVYNPPRGGRQCLYLPDVIADLAPWLLLAFSMWSTELPEVFPAEPEWTSNPEWMTDSELRAKAQLDAQRAEAERIISEAQASIAVAEKTLLELREEVGESERLLLTGTDTPLVDVVHKTLEAFGFDVTDVDAGLAAGQAKKEDLRVADGDWISLCEVKGYTKGAKLGDLGKLQGYATLFAAETGRPPEAMWYVVNHWRETDPSSRAKLLQGGEEYIETFAEQGGLVVDTRDLFRLRKAVEAGSINAEDVRESLKRSRGRFQAPA